MNLPTPAVYPSDRTPQLVAATLLEGLATNLIGFFLTINWVQFDDNVSEEILRRMPSVSRVEADEAVRRAKERWCAAYTD